MCETGKPVCEPVAQRSVPRVLQSYSDPGMDRSDTNLLKLLPTPAMLNSQSGERPPFTHASGSKQNLLFVD